MFVNRTIQRGTILLRNANLNVLQELMLTLQVLVNYVPVIALHAQALILVNLAIPQSIQCTTILHPRGQIPLITHLNYSA
jgi:hypothetical protein